ncbi:hypothetical protein FQA39_LY11952 [Lamprigera yunnana]|nr:hypothetical protein FQA39_LY11952 [Lamprigera yunnana]
MANRNNEDFNQYPRPFNATGVTQQQEEADLQPQLQPTPLPPYLQQQPLQQQQYDPGPYMQSDLDLPQQQAQRPQQTVQPLPPTLQHLPQRMSQQPFPTQQPSPQQALFYKRPSQRRLSRRMSDFIYRKPSSQGYTRLTDELTTLMPRPSIILPQLQDSEKKFFDLVGYGDVGVVTQFLEENSAFNVNAINFQGISALHIAVQNHNEPMVEYLLSQRNVQIGDCFLHAVRENQRGILQLLLNKLQEVSPGLEAAYNELADEISTFAVELIGSCRSTGEMELILRQKSGLTHASQHYFPRLVLAMDYKQKEFVAHPNTQQILETAWHGDWIEWRLKPWLITILYPVYRLVMLPIISLMCLFAPRNAMVQHWSLPINKMISHNSSFMLFLIIIFFESSLEKVAQKRSPPNSGLEVVIVLYVIGYIWSSGRLMTIQGPRRHFKQLWNCHNLIMYFLFLCTFIFWLLSFLDVTANDQTDLERKYWHHLDPILLAEGTFAIATIMAYFKLLYLCRLNYYLGPLQISLGKMSADIAKYFGLFLIVILSFSVGMCTFYQYYDSMVQTDTSSGMKTAQQSSFINFQSTLKTFFWALFCMSALESADVIIENLPGETEGTTIINKHVFTETVGYFAFALFEVLTVIILLNMLIATMSNTFQRVNDNTDVEWTFGRTEFYLEYILQTTLPSPFNLIPTANGLSAVAEWVKVLFGKPLGKTARFSLGHCCYIESEMEESLSRDFPILMSQLIQRYFREKDSTAETADMENIKQEVSEIRQLLIEYLERN